MSPKRHAVGVETLLAKVPLFSGLDARDLEHVLGLMTPLRVAAGTVIARQGHAGQEFMIILEGTATVQRDGEVVAHVGPGDFQGEISLLDGGPRTATVIADTPMELMVATRGEFSGLLDANPTIARNMLPALAHRVRSLSEDHHQH